MLEVTMQSDEVAKGRLAQELLTLADRRGAELDLQWHEAIEALGIAAKSLTRAYSPMFINSNATQQNAWCKEVLDKGFASTVIIKDFGHNEAFRQRWMEGAKWSG
jgi:hypothetical protein